jgi:ferredoxin
VRVTVDRALCVCSQGCVDLVPSVFATEGYELKVLNPDPPEELRAAVEEAAALCPTGAIEVEAPGAQDAGSA